MADTRVALIGIIVSDTNSAGDINELLHEYSNYIVSRMGVPYRQKNISIISIVLDAPNDIINALSGKLGQLNGVRTMRYTLLQRR